MEWYNDLELSKPTEGYRKGKKYWLDSTDSNLLPWNITIHFHKVKRKEEDSTTNKMCKSANISIFWCV